MTDKTFYIADDNITPLREGRALRPSTADTTATRPTTANSLLSSDPFASPVSSRPPSIRHLQPPSSPSASRVSFPDSLSTGLRNRPSLIGNRSHAFFSARSSFRISSTPIPNGHSTVPANENTTPKQTFSHVVRLKPNIKTLEKYQKHKGRIFLLDCLLYYLFRNSRGCFPVLLDLHTRRSGETTIMYSFR